MLTAHAYIDVTAAEPAIAFYCDGLGLSVKRRLSPTWIELAGATCRSSFSPTARLTPISGRGRCRAASSAIGRRSISTSSSPISTPRWRGLVALGGSLDRAIADRDYGRIAYMADPFGNGFDLIEFSGTGYDGIARRT